jgi:hypothetical protein
MADELAEYSYEALNANIHEILLLGLWGCDDSDADIQCAFLPFPLDKSKQNNKQTTIKYNALSYVWGAPEPPELMFSCTGSNND